MMTHTATALRHPAPIPALLMLMLTLCIMMMTSARAEFTLLDATTANRSVAQGWELAFRVDRAPAPAIPADAVTLPDDLDESDLAFLAHIRNTPAGRSAMADPAMRQARAALIALPATLPAPVAADWQVTGTVLRYADGSPGNGVPVSSGLTWNVVTVGSFVALEVLYNPAEPDATGRTVAEATFSVRPAAVASRSAARALPAAPLHQLPLAREAANSLFINANELNEAPTSGSENYPDNVPAAPGTMRVQYRVGDRLLRIPLADLGMTEAQFLDHAIIHHGQAVGRGIIDGTDVVIYAPRRHTLQDRTDSLWFSPEAPASSPQYATREAFDSLSPEGTEVAIRRTRVFNNYTWYQRGYQGTAPPTRERFFMYRIATGQTVNTSLVLHDMLTSDTFEVLVEMHGISSKPNFAPDHTGDFSLNTIPAPRIFYDGSIPYTFTHTFVLPSVPSSSTLTLRHALPANSVDCPGGSPCDGIGGDTQVTRSVSISYEGQPRAEAGLRGTISITADDNSPAPVRVTMGGFPVGTTSSEILILDVTDPRMPIRVLNAPTFTDGSGTVAVEFEVPASGGNYHIELLSAATAPMSVAPPAPMPVLPAAPQRLRGIVVRPAPFAATIADYMLARGPEFVEFDPQAAFDRWNGGQESAEALREGLRAIVNGAPSRVPFPVVVFMGHGSLDPRDYLGTLGSTPQIPVFTGLAPPSVGYYEGLIDQPYELMSDGDSYSDIILGRIPAKTAANLAIALNRQVRFEQLQQQFIADERPGVFVAGNGPEFHFYQPEWLSRWALTGHPVLRIDVPVGVSNAETQRAILLDAMAAAPSGVSFIYFLGHGTTNGWGSQMMNATHVRDTNTEDKWPFVAAMNCLNGDFGPPTATMSLGELWLFTTRTGFPEFQRGAIGTFAPANADFIIEQVELSRVMLDWLGVDPELRPRTTGELVLLTRNKFVQRFPFFNPTQQKFVLLGDPTASLTLEPERVGDFASVGNWALYSSEDHVW